MRGGRRRALCFRRPCAAPLVRDPDTQGTRLFSSARFARAMPAAAGARGPVSVFCGSSQIVPDVAACTPPVCRLSQCRPSVWASLGVCASQPLFLPRGCGAQWVSSRARALPGLAAEGSVPTVTTGRSLSGFWRPQASVGSGPLLPCSGGSSGLLTLLLPCLPVVKGSCTYAGPG